MPGYIMGSPIEQYTFITIVKNTRFVVIMMRATSPIEMGVALFLHMAAVRIVQTLMGVDWLSVYAHLSMKAIGSCINHVNHAVVIPLGFGVKIDAAYHHRHHTKGTTHFAQFVPLFDRLFQSGRKGS